MMKKKKLKNKRMKSLNEFLTLSSDLIIKNLLNLSSMKFSQKLISSFCSIKCYKCYEVSYFLCVINQIIFFTFDTHAFGVLGFWGGRLDLI